MGTSYYKLKPPFTSLAIKASGPYITITLWVNNGYSGKLVVRSQELKEVLKVFFDTDVGIPPVATYHGGEKVGIQVKLNDSTLEDTDVVLSEYGEVYTLRGLRAL